MTTEEWHKLTAWCREHITPEHPLYGPAYLTLIREWRGDAGLSIAEITLETGREFARYVKAQK